MADYYATDQLRDNMTALVHGKRPSAVHAQAIKVYGATAERVPKWASFPLCGTARPHGAVSTGKPITCKRCLRLIDRQPCTATVTRWHNRFPCELGGPHVIHRALAGTLVWHADHVMTTCAGTGHTVLWWDLEYDIRVTVRTVPTAVAGHRGPVPTEVYTWFYDGREVESGTDRERVEAGIPARLTAINAEEDETETAYGFPDDACPDHAAELHVCG